MGADEASLRELLAGWEAAGAEAGPAERLLAVAQEIIAAGETDMIPPDLWHRYLDRTRRCDFLRSLTDSTLRYAWAETTFEAVGRSNYTLEVMLRQRVASHPRRILFQQFVGRQGHRCSYDMAARQLRSVATAFLVSQPETPRVAIISENSLESAICDLACMVHDIFVTPLNPRLGDEILAQIIERLRINIVVIRTTEQRTRLERIRRQAAEPFRLWLLDPEAEVESSGDERLAEACARLGGEQIEQTLDLRPRRDLRDTLTVMFTSGSTGFPKGVEYSAYNLIAKRFARAAALPRVGDEEVFLCYLPLYHTFGRYLEMMGSFFWGGTYIFTGNPSAETLLKGMREVRPTVLISIPRRWHQIRDSCLREMEGAADRSGQERAFRKVVGGRLKWGLSAAGRLDPAVFNFFQRHGVDLCSGFGMTEATGGITMTPPGAYEDDTVGVPLPGIAVRLRPEGEMQIAGHYVGRYLDDAEHDADEQRWLSTGDIFKQRSSGYYEIVDRVKDIYKNSKGQTVAPHAVEQMFVGVPGILRTFLVGDGRDYNVLLIVPDPDDPILRSSPFSTEATEYFQQIVTAANGDLAPYERVVNFAVLDRDFDAAHGELTAKRSYRRKVIEENFAAVIEGLYMSNFVEITRAELRIQVPRWFHRDLGILEADIVDHPDGLLNRRSGRVLTLTARPELAAVEIGDLQYRLAGTVIDLGRFARQPALWVGNPSLIAFCPCREGWDLPLGPIAAQVFLPHREGDEQGSEASLASPEHLDPSLERINELCSTTLFAESEAALGAVRELEGMLPRLDLRQGNVIRRRLEALARHPNFELRCLAYQILLLDDPVPDYSQVLPSFVLSGLPFLSEKSIREISTSKVEPFQLEAFHKRLEQYREQLAWPASALVRSVFNDIFRLLSKFARESPEYYSAVRAELVCWILHEVDPVLSELARDHFDSLAAWFEDHLAEDDDGQDPERWRGKIVFAAGLAGDEIERLEAVLVGTTFLKESVMLAFDGEQLAIAQVPDQGIWISRILSMSVHDLYRVSINTNAGKHFDLLLVMRWDLLEEPVRKTNYWMIALHGQFYEQPVMPRFGCSRLDLGALSMAYIGELTVWEKLREMAGGEADRASYTGLGIRDLFVRGMSAFFLAWRSSGRRIVPGLVTPSNVVVPMQDYRPGVKILSLTGWQPCRDHLSLLRPMLENFFLKTVANYPQLGSELDYNWIFDACVEALGVEEARDFLSALQTELSVAESTGVDVDLQSLVAEYQESLGIRYYVPRPLRCAIEHYSEWESVNPQATSQARAQYVEELVHLYLPDRLGDIARYRLFRDTYFAGVGETTSRAIDGLLDKMFRCPDESPTHMVELAELQSTLADADDRLVFSRMVFPSIPADHPLDVLTVGRQERRHSVVSSRLRDERGESYKVREPIEPAEIGKLYRIVLDQGLPVSMTEQDHHIVVTDREERVVGGICFKLQEGKVAHLGGLVVSASLGGSQLREELLEDFCARMSGQGVNMINTHFISRDFFLAHGFQVDEKWGGLVRFLGEGREA